MNRQVPLALLVCAMTAALSAQSPQRPQSHGRLFPPEDLGLLEAPYLKLPVVNVGRRQSERHHASNVFFVNADRESIAKQIRAIIEDDETKQKIRACENPFGDGHTGERVAELLATTPIDEKLLNKDLSY